MVISTMATSTDVVQALTALLDADAAGPFVVLTQVTPPDTSAIEQLPWQTGSLYTQLMDWQSAGLVSTLAGGWSLVLGTLNQSQIPTGLAVVATLLALNGDTALTGTVLPTTSDWVPSPADAEILTEAGIQYTDRASLGTILAHDGTLAVFYAPETLRTHSFVTMTVLRILSELESALQPYKGQPFVHLPAVESLVRSILSRPQSLQTSSYQVTWSPGERTLTVELSLTFYHALTIQVAVIY